VFTTLKSYIVLYSSKFKPVDFLTNNTFFHCSNFWPYQNVNTDSLVKVQYLKGEVQLQNPKRCVIYLNIGLYMILKLWTHVYLQYSLVECGNFFMHF
jgi:uncharacterized membrane protein YwzB